MKTWMFIVLILVVVFVIVPLVYFGIIAKSVSNITNETKSFGVEMTSKCDGPKPQFTNPGPGKRWTCDEKNGWYLATI